MFVKKIVKKDKSALEALKEPGEPEESKQDNIKQFEPPLRKQQKTSGGQSFSSKDVSNYYSKVSEDLQEDLKHKATAHLLAAHGEDACRTLDIDTIHEEDARTRALRNLEISKNIKEGKVDTKYYRGQNGYATFTEKTEDQIHKSKITGSMGPIRASNNIRATCRFDFNPSLCKDWHVSGQCGFGDSCIYIHDRGDYKSGWELEKDWEESEKRRVLNGGESEEEEQEPLEIDKVPKTCSICEKTFKNAVSTKCGHFFCESCALTRNKSTPFCATCNKPTNGIFNDATKILQKMRDDAEAVDIEKGNRAKVMANRKKEEAEGDDEGPAFIGGDDFLKGVIFETDAAPTSTQAARSKVKATADHTEQTQAEMEQLAAEYKKKMKKKGFKTSESDWLM